MAADYRHIGGLENRLGRHYSRFSPFLPTRPLQVNHLRCENCAMLGRIGEDGLTAPEPARNAAMRRMPSLTTAVEGAAEAGFPD